MSSLTVMFPSWSKYVLVSSSLFAAMTVIERVAAWRRDKTLYSRRNTRTSLLILLGHYVTSMFWICFAVVPAFHYLQKFSPWTIGPRANDGISAYFSLWFVALIFLDDFVYYVHHLVAHRSRFFWAIHHTHHSSNVYNMLVAARNSWFDINIVVFWFPLVLLGFDPDVVLAQHGLSMFFNIFIHTKLVGKLGVLDHVFMTPSNHRVHHAVNEPYRYKNYGCSFVIWDKLFGTYAAETEKVVFESDPSLVDEPLLTTVTQGIRQSIRSRQSAR